MSLKVVSRMYVLTSNGEREIQLCVGDITALPVKDKVDVILISAFPNDYIPMKTSVIGALKHNLGISVRELAKIKKEDLRRQFSCWISEKLPSHLPYRQLLCFERQNRGTVEILDAVKEIFRAMMPIFNNENKSIITPLLATGFQDVETVKMLQTLVTSAVEWMQMGLGLQTMKVVIYARDPEKLTSDDLKCISKFNGWKLSVESKKFLPKNPEIKYDVFLVYSDQDVDLSRKVTEKLKTYKKSLKILSAAEMTTKKETWQHDIFMAMISCIRVVPLLDNAFLENSVCIDQYNIALCCNRYTHRHILAPLRLQRATFPLYMGMVQWISCGLEDSMLEKASMILIEQISVRSMEVSLHYDVFISYSHRNLAAAKLFLDTFQKLNPDLKVFFDYDALKTGVSWQQTLYHSVDASCCVVSLLSTDYIASAMCTEEFHLSLAKHFAKEKELELVAVSLEPVHHLVLGDYIQPVEAHGKELGDVAMTTCKAICDWLKTGNKTEVFSEAVDPVNIDEISERRRELLYHKMYRVEKSQLIMLPTSQKQETATSKDAAQNEMVKQRVVTNPKTQPRTQNEGGKQRVVTNRKTQTKTDAPKVDTQRKKSVSKQETPVKKDNPRQESQRRKSSVRLVSSAVKMTPKVDTQAKIGTQKRETQIKKVTPKHESQTRKVSPKQESKTEKETTKENLQTKKGILKQKTEKTESNENGQAGPKEETPKVETHGTNTTAPADTCQLYLSYTLSDQKYVSLLEKMLRKKMPNLVINTPSKGDEAELIEAAGCIVVFLSTKYLKSKKQMEEFNLILSKERMSHNRRFMYVIWLNYIPPKPTYIHLVPCDTALTDELWEVSVGRLRKTGSADKVFAQVASVKEAVEKEFGRLDDSDVLALLKVCCDVLAMLSSSRPLHNMSIEDVILVNVIQQHKDAGTLEDAVAAKK